MKMKPKKPANYGKNISKVKGGYEVRTSQGNVYTKTKRGAHKVNNQATQYAGKQNHNKNNYKWKQDLANKKTDRANKVLWNLTGMQAAADFSGGVKTLMKDAANNKDKINVADRFLQSMASKKNGSTTTDDSDKVTSGSSSGMTEWL